MGQGNRGLKACSPQCLYRPVGIDFVNGLLYCETHACMWSSLDIVYNIKEMQCTNELTFKWSMSVRSPYQGGDSTSTMVFKETFWIRRPLRSIVVV